MRPIFYRALLLILVVIVFIRPIATAWEQKDYFFTKGYNDQFKSLENAYYNSQYVKDENPGIIPDETFESYMGGAFVRGVNPILRVHEHPPLGRYIIGLSTLLFDNARTVVLFTLSFSILGMYLIARKILKSSLLALIPLGIYINEPLFITKLTIAPLLEPIQLLFIVFSIYFFIKGVESKKSLSWFIAASLMVGAVMSIRFFVLGLAIFLAMFLYMAMRRKFDSMVKQFIISLPFALIVLFASYTKTMMDGYSPYQILAVQKYIFAYHQSKIIVPFTFWDLLFLNRWHTWWADRSIISDVHWIVAWPIAMLLTGISFVFTILKKHPQSAAKNVLFAWVIAYCALLSFGTSTTRYFLPLVPFLYILGFDFILQLVHVLRKKRK